MEEGPNYYCRIHMRCGRCALHFIALTNDELAFIQQDIRCPECGAPRRGLFAYMELVEGFIFDEKKGEAMGTLFHLKEENPEKVQALRPGRTSFPVLERTTRSEFSGWRGMLHTIKKLLKRKPQL